MIESAQKFADWAIEFDQATSDFPELDPSVWDWAAFHSRGIHLSHRLKEEVGDAYRVVYMKPCEDPDHRSDFRREVMADGTLVPLPPLRRTIAASPAADAKEP